MPSIQNESPQVSAKAQPWKAFMVLNEKSETTNNEKMEGSVRLRAEADDKGSLGG